MNNIIPKPKESKELYCVYLHTCVVTWLSYIGRTVVGVDQRFSKHMTSVHSGSNLHFHNALRKYGEDAFTSEIIYISLEKDIKHLNEIEMQLIADYDTFHNGYNMTVGGEGVGSGEDHPHFGKVGEDCHNFGLVRSKETRAKMKVAHEGKKMSVTARANMSESKRGNKNSEGYIHTEESKAKISEAAKDRTTYTFKHEDGTMFHGIQYDFRMKYSLNAGHLGSVIHGTRKTIKGWRLLK